jgi:hypothetical protein
MIKFRLASLALCVSFLGTVAQLQAQGTTSLRGVITDPQKGAVPTAKVTLLDKDNGSVHSAISQPTGEYQFSQLPPGLYSLTVEAPGFSVARVEELRLLVDTPSTTDIKLELASNAATVNVNADVEQLNAVDASVGNAFQERQVQSLPIQTRNAVQLLGFQPGVTQNGEVMGARRDQNNITLDGVDVNDNQNALSGLNGNNQGGLPVPTSNPTSTTYVAPATGFNSALPVPLDSVQEFRVTVTGMGAEDGRSSGGQVSLVTRSGSNTLHGSAYEYNRNTDYTANNWFNNRSGVDRPQLVRNQFGASLGGPIKKDRIFYFFNYERRIDHSDQTQQRTVPSATLREGIVQFQTTNGTIYSLTPAQVTQADPLHIGASPAMLNILNSYPVGNAPALGADLGLNFDGYLFNAPDQLDYRTYVARMDWLIDSAAKHTVSFRGTLSNEGQTNLAAELPGQSPASELLADNRGFGVRYTALLSPTMTNTANFGLTRIGYEITGNNNTSLSFGDLSALQNFTRGNSRINPTWNVTDNFTWVKGSHTISAGFNFRFFNNDLISYGNSYETYSFSRGSLYGLGADIDQDVLNVVGAPNAVLANGPATTSAMGDLLGTLTGGSVTYNYNKSGGVIPIGAPTKFDFVSRGYEEYVQDSWKISPKLTVTYGLRYQYDTVPYESTGLQVLPNTPLDVYFADRVYAMDNGIPGNQLPNGERLSYSLAGPVNGKQSWYKPDYHNFAPRLAAAYSISDKTVFRAGGSIAYDQFGNDLVAVAATSGSVGLSSLQTFPVAYNFTTAPRYTGAALPALPPAPPGGFPFTPPDDHAISGTTFGISPSLVAPYALLANVALSHQFNHGFTLEVGYVGRFSRQLLSQQDINTPLLFFKDPASGITLAQADTSMSMLYNGGLLPNTVKANPSLVPTNAFVQNQFPGLANYYFPGSATANYFYGVYGVYAGSDLDMLHSLDRVTSAAFPNCISKTGCYTFFAPQASGDPVWTNSASANYDALTVTIRRSLQNGLSFDLNYAWSHSIDNASIAASGVTGNGAAFQDAYEPSLSRASSDFDLRHQINANILYELPFGKGKLLLNSAPTWLNEIVGGWQISSLIHIESGLPSTITGDGAYNSNYDAQTLAVAVGPGAPTGGSVVFDQNGNPSIFSSTKVTSDFVDAYAGGSGTRALVRMPWQKNVDLAATKNFPLPWEHHFLQLRAEAFNAFNFVNFTNISLALSSPSTFGNFTAAADARVLQLALRYTF